VRIGEKFIQVKVRVFPYLVQVELQSGGEDAGCGAEATESTVRRAGR